MNYISINLLPKKVSLTRWQPKVLATMTCYRILGETGKIQLSDSEQALNLSVTEVSHLLQALNLSVTQVSHLLHGIKHGSFSFTSWQSDYQNRLSLYKSITNVPAHTKHFACFGNCCLAPDTCMVPDTHNARQILFHLSHHYQAPVCAS